MDWLKAEHKIKCLTNLKHLNISKYKFIQWVASG